MIFGFCPILYPGLAAAVWLATLNWWFPFGHMAVIVRAGLTTGHGDGHRQLLRDRGGVGIAGVAVSAWALGRRG